MCRISDFGPRPACIYSSQFHFMKLKRLDGIVPNKIRYNVINEQKVQFEHCKVNEIKHATLLLQFYRYVKLFTNYGFDYVN